MDPGTHGSFSLWVHYSFPFRGGGAVCAPCCLLGLSVLGQGSNLYSLQQNCGVLTTGPPGKSQVHHSCLCVSALLPVCLDHKVYASLFQYGEYWLLLLSPAFSWVNAVCSADALVVACAFRVSPKNPLPDPSSKVDTHVFFSEFYSFSFYI